MSLKKKRLAKNTNRRRRIAAFELLEDRRLLVSDWKNAIQPADVNNDLIVSPIDALLVINHLSRSNQRVLSSVKPALAPFIDPSGDGQVSPLDALRVINYLQRHTLEERVTPRLESESVAAPLAS